MCILGNFWIKSWFLPQRYHSKAQLFTITKIQFSRLKNFFDKFKDFISHCNCFQAWKCILKKFYSKCNFDFCQNVWNLILFMISTQVLTLCLLWPLLKVKGNNWSTYAPGTNNCTQCPFVYNLVCGHDGKMYSSPCIAICRNVVKCWKITKIVSFYF